VPLKRKSRSARALCTVYAHDSAAERAGNTDRTRYRTSHESRRAAAARARARIYLRPRRASHVTATRISRHDSPPHIRIRWVMRDERRNIRTPRTTSPPASGTRRARSSHIAHRSSSHHSQSRADLSAAACAHRHAACSYNARIHTMRRALTPQVLTHQLPTLCPETGAKHAP